MADKYTSLDHEFYTKGYLSLQKFTKWLKQYHPIMQVSYPTARSMIDKGTLKALRVGKMHRISHAEGQRYIAHGKYENRPTESEPDNDN